MYVLMKFVFLESFGQLFWIRNSTLLVDNIYIIFLVVTNLFRQIVGIPMGTKTRRQAPAHWLKFYEEVVIESEARNAVVQLKSKA